MMQNSNGIKRLVENGRGMKVLGGGIGRRLKTKHKCQGCHLWSYEVQILIQEHKGEKE